MEESPVDVTDLCPSGENIPSEPSIVKRQDQYSEGVWLVAFLKYRLNDDFELNPQSYAGESSVYC
jgi:hypothetical protein